MLRVLIGCECSGEVRRAMAARGHFAVSVDLQPADDGVGYGMADISRGWHYQGDLLDFVYGDFGQPKNWDLGIMHPECTYLTNAGVHWLHKPDSAPGAKVLKGLPRWKALRKAADFYIACKKLPIPRLAVENPIMHRYAAEMVGGRAHQIVQPWMFGHMEMKATGFWLKNLRKLRPTCMIGPPDAPAYRLEWARVHRMAPSATRSKERSRTFTGIAEAFAEQWTQPGFCNSCGACIPPRDGEGRCPECDPTIEVRT